MDTQQIVVPSLQFPPALPVNLPEVFEAQVRCLMAYGIHGEVGIDGAKFLDDAMALAKEFTYSLEIADIGLNQVTLVHYGVRDRYLCEVANVNIFADPDEFTLFPGVTVPEGFCIMQSQFGTKYKNRSPWSMRECHYALEQLGVPKEGLTAFLYEPSLLRKSFMNFPGAVTLGSGVPCLDLRFDIPELGGGHPDRKDPHYGSVSVSRGG
ncbi:MAG: hypothetical protein WCO23_00475 [bacterium]